MDTELVKRAPVECQMWFQEAGQIDELWIIDVDGEFLVAPGSYYSETPAAVVDELGTFLGSMTFGEMTDVRAARIGRP